MGSAQSRRVGLLSASAGSLWRYEALQLGAHEPKGVGMAGVTPNTRRVGYRLSEVAEMSGLGLRTVQRRVAEGDLIAHRCGKAVLVFPDDLTAWLNTFETVVPGGARRDLGGAA